MQTVIRTFIIPFKQIRITVIRKRINKIGFRMSGSIQEYEQYLQSDREFRPMAMQVLAAGALKPDEAIEYVTRFPKIESVLFGASSRAHIQQTKDLIEQGFRTHSTAI